MKLIFWNVWTISINTNFLRDGNLCVSSFLSLRRFSFVQFYFITNASFYLDQRKAELNYAYSFSITYTKIVLETKRFQANITPCSMAICSFAY